MPTPADLNVLRSWVGGNAGAEGDDFDDVDVDERIGRLGSVEAAALEILRTIRNDIVSNGAAQMSIAGDYSENWAKNLDVLDANIGQLERATGAATVSVTRLVRTRRR